MKRNRLPLPESEYESLFASTTLNTSTEEFCSFTHAIAMASRPRPQRRLLIRGEGTTRTHLSSGSTPLSCASSRPQTAPGCGPTFRRTLGSAFPARGIRADRTNAFPIRLTKRYFHLSQMLTSKPSSTDLRTTQPKPRISLPASSLSRLCVKGRNIVRSGDTENRLPARGMNRTVLFRCLNPPRKRKTASSFSDYNETRPKTAGCLLSRGARTRGRHPHESVRQHDWTGRSSAHGISVSMDRISSGTEARLRWAVEIVLPKAVVRCPC